MSDVTARLDLPLIKPSQAQKHVTHNEALQVLDGLVQAALEEVGAETPPFEPDPGTLFALGASPTGDWLDQGGKLAFRSGEGWIFIDPQQGWHAFDKATSQFKIYDGSAWNGLTANFQNLSGVGIGTTSDSINRLSLSSDASLFNNAGAGHQLKVNKATTGDTASLLFQSGFTGHAEMGLAGDTAFSVKITDDGATWYDALRASAATQTVEFGLPITGVAVQQTAIDDGPGRLLKTGASATVLAGGLETLAATSGSANALNVTTGANLASVSPGYMIRFRSDLPNTNAATINLDNTGALPCVTITGVPLPAGYIRTDANTTAVFDGSQWVLDRVPEHGSNGNGAFVRRADGTLTAQAVITLAQTSTALLQATITFPQAFSDTTRTVVSTELESFSSATANIGQLGVTRSHGFSTTGCIVETHMIDGFSNLASGDTATLRLHAFGFWY